MCRGTIIHQDIKLQENPDFNYLLLIGNSAQVFKNGSRKIC